MTDFSKLMEKAKEIESKMKESQENIKKIEVEGVSGANDVKVTLNGCLLYTSPSPRDRTRSRMPSSA